MRTIQKGREPRSLQTYRHIVDATFGNLPKEIKEEIQTQLVEEQHGLCCYCQSRIRADGTGMKIEHWQSQSEDKYPERQLDYTNMLGACLGGEKHGEKSPRETHHCDTAKGDADLCFSVCDPVRPVEREIRFLGDGRIESTDIIINNDLDKVLNLNWARLVSNRKAVLEAFKQRLEGGNLNAAQELKKWDGSHAGDLPEFAQVMVFWLQKRLARAAA